MTKSQLLGAVSSEELVEWMALWQLRAEEREKHRQQEKLHGR